MISGHRTNNGEELKFTQRLTKYPYEVIQESEICNITVILDNGDPINRN